MSTAGRPRDNPNAGAYLGAMLGTFVGFWSVLPRLEDGVLAEALGPVGVLLTIALAAVLLLPGARRVALAVGLGLAAGTAIALLTGAGLVAAGA